MSNTTKSSGLLLGTVIGGVIGAASAILLTPKSGAKMREDLASKYHVINDKMQQLASTVGDKTQEEANKVSEAKGNLTDKVMDVKEKFTDKTSDVKDNVLNAWQDRKEEVKRDAESQRQPFSSYNKN
jgi:gas vesicle protein